MRVFGLSGSGFDIDQMVKDLMKGHRVSYDKLWQKKTQLEYKKTDYNDMYTTLRDFRNTTVFNYGLVGTLMPKTTSSTAENIVSATANSDAANISHTIKVTQLAEAANLTSSAGITIGASKDTLKEQFNLMVDTPFEVIITNGSTSKPITVDPNKSINDFVSSINNAGLGIKANYDATLDRFFMSTTGSGVNVGINFLNTVGADGINFINSLKLTNAVTGTNVATGKDAIFDLDGVTNLTQASNNFTISGVTYNLKAEGSANIAVAADNNKSIETVKTFIDSYNAILEKINGELKEEKYSDYMPLTSDQKKEMKESEIIEWEKRAKSGMLHRDSILQDAVYKLRSDISTPISGLTGEYNTLSSIGVTTGLYSEGGKLHLDETKLRKALENDPDVLSKIFKTSSDVRANQGVAVRMYDTLKTTLDKIVAAGGASSTITADNSSTLAKQIISYNRSLDTMNNRLNDIEKRYYKQFSAMETALSKMSQQSSWIAQQFGG